MGAVARPRALVVRTGALGDFVATLPVLHRLAESYALTVVTSARYAPLIGASATVVDAEGAAAARVIAGTADLGDVEIAIAWTALAAAGLRASGARTVLEGAPRPPPGVAIHDHLWSPLVPHLGPRDRDPYVLADLRSLDAIDARGPASFVIAPGSGGAAKRWPIAWWHEVADALGDVVWVAGPLEQDENDFGTPRWDDLDLMGLAAVATRCRAWMCPDSGPGHLARAVGAPTGVVFTGATDPLCWAPPGATVFGPEAAPRDVARWARDVAL